MVVYICQFNSLSSFHPLRNEVGSFAEIWMNQEFVIQSEVSQKEENKYHMFTHTHTHTHTYIWNLELTWGKERVGWIKSEMFLSLLINIYLLSPEVSTWVWHPDHKPSMFEVLQAKETRHLSLPIPNSETLLGTLIFHDFRYLYLRPTVLCCRQAPKGDGSESENFCPPLPHIPLIFAYPQLLIESWCCGFPCFLH